MSIREEDDQGIQAGYETMETGSADSSDEEIRENNEGHNIIRDYVLNDTTGMDNMVATNEYVETIRTAQEWDAVNDCNPTTQRHINDDDKVPEEFFEGLTFWDKNQLQFALMGWSIINNVEYHKVCSNKTRLSVECIYRKDINQPCPWRLQAVCNPARASYWKITKWRGPHCCTHPVMANGHKNLTAKFISNYIGDTIRIQVDVKPREIIAIINAKFNVRTTYYKAWDAKNKAIARIFGSYEKSYTSLYRLMESIRDVMSGSVYRIHENNGRFHSVFWSFGASIAAWELCRPVLSLDETFLVGKYKGTLLAAVGQDADDGLFPLAFAIVESESTESWTWFLQALLDLVHPISTRGDLCIISYKHPGLIRGCRDILPWVKHVHCLRHLRENFKKFLRTQPVVDVEGLCNKMYSAGHTDEERHFNRLMREILTINKEAHDWLIQKDITKWTLVHDGGSRYGNMTTNSSESFNAVLKKARGLPIQGLIISIYYQLVNMFNKRSEDGQKMIGRLAPSVQDALQKVEDIVRQFPTPQIINPHEFQVFDKQGRGYKVEIIDNVTCTCSCKKTEMYHIPCVHAIVALSARRINHHNFVSKYYTTQMYRQTYAFEFHFIPDREYWPNFDVSAGIIPLLPPFIRRRFGRPRHARIRTTMDENRAATDRKCSLCHEIGHNKATCPRIPSIRPYRERRSNRPPPC